jgi:Spy/CpxP family protein refolding chaperone
MNSTRHFTRLAACSLALALTGTPPLLQAADQPTPPCQGGPGTPGCNGWGPGMMGGGGYGMGPGMMGGYGGYGMGPGMMGGYGGGYGMGPGMMGGYGMGPGMMGPYWGSGLDLSVEQQAKVNKIQDETRKAHWALMGEMMNQQARLRDLYQAPKRDDAAIDRANKEIGKLQQQMYDSSVAAQKRMEAILSKEQQEKLRTYWRRGPAPNTTK